MAENSNANNASCSQVWPADTDTKPSAERPVAGPNMRSTIKRFGLPQSCCIAKNISYVDTVFDNFISNTPKPLKTHLQLNVGKLGHFDALRVATEDHLRSRRIFKTTASVTAHDDDPMEVDVLSRKGKGKGKFGKGNTGGKKGKENHSFKGYGEQNSENSPLFEGECRNCGKYGHKSC